MPSAYESALFLHILGAVLFFAGATVAAVGLEAARRRDRPAEIAMLLGLTRVGVLLVAAGAVLLLAFGLWLVDLGGWSYGTGWIVAALTLFVVSVALGAIGGRTPKRARLLATRLAGGPPAAGRELRRLLDDPRSLALNYGSGAAALAVLALMVFKPG